MVTGDFSGQLNRFSVKLTTRRQAIFTGVVEGEAESIVFGSILTGSPGQPEDLREGAWTTVYEGEDAAVISTTDPSARSVEDGISHLHGNPIHLKSAIGGFHSLSDSVTRADKIVEAVTRKVVGSDA